MSWNSGKGANMIINHIGSQVLLLICTLTQDFSTRRLDDTYCSRRASTGSSGSGHPSPTKSDHRYRSSPSSPNSFRPSCHYYGNKRFRHCAFFGDPHLKTFDNKYQTCRVHGTWTLLENPYLLVQVHNEPVAEQTYATAPTKMSVTVKSGSTPCTLEKRYEADGAYPLSSTFVDGTDRPGADKTVYVVFKEEESDKRETVEIYIKYIATKLIIRRVGKYLAFSALLPEEVIQESITFNEARTELCTTGCPSREQIKLEKPTESVVSAEKALKECTDLVGLSVDLHNNLTDIYLDWCIFDVMTAGISYDFVAVAHTAQLDAMKMDPASLKNKTSVSEWFYEVASQNIISTNSTSNIPHSNSSLFFCLAAMWLFFA